MKQRVQKIISSAGFCSRRNAEILINQGRIKINGRTALIGDKADPNLDKVSVDGKFVSNNTQTKVILLNKPAGFITSCNDPFGRKTVLNLIPTNLTQGLHPIGRLDKDTRGALLLTNNGELTLRLTHPRYSHSKTYKVLVKGKPNQNKILQWEQGIFLDGEKTLEAKVDLLENYPNNSLLKVTIREGRNRQIRRVAALLGHPVIDLQRIAIDKINLDGLEEGEWRELNHEEWEKILC
tara:strand:+ start:557 stop:1267 length:711 start_codon:yes stop_codon:yes gene_type:complete